MEGRGQRRPPFFICGTARSGTTLVRVLLDSHPRLSIGPESNLLHHWFHGIDASSLSRWPMEPSFFDEAALLAFERIHVAYMEQRGKQRWGDKTPGYWRLIPRIARVWPDAQFVYCLRDGRDVVCSMRERWGWHLHYASRVWAGEVMEALDLASLFGDQVHIIGYEDLVADPVSVMRGVIRFLDEEWDESILEPGRLPHDDFETDSPRAVGPIDTRSVGRWKRELNRRERWIVNRLLRSSLESAGYPV